jgi:hypothetical protein
LIARETIDAPSTYVDGEPPIRARRGEWYGSRLRIVKSLSRSKNHSNGPRIGPGSSAAVTDWKWKSGGTPRMSPAPAWLLIGWIILHVLAFAWACGTRVAAGSCVEGLAQLGFFVALALVGMAMLIARQVDVGWLWSALTFMAMVITVVIDFRHVGKPAVVGIQR